jgi:hypothetical protein
MTASRAIQKHVFTRARKKRARISHVSVFQNVDSTHAPSPKSVRKPTPDSTLNSRRFPPFFAICTPGFGVPDDFRPPENGSEIKTDAFRNPVANTAQQTRVG